MFRYLKYLLYSVHYHNKNNHFYLTSRATNSSRKTDLKLKKVNFMSESNFVRIKTLNICNLYII